MMFEVNIFDFGLSNEIIDFIVFVIVISLAIGIAKSLDIFDFEIILLLFSFIAIILYFFDVIPISIFIFGLVILGYIIYSHIHKNEEQMEQLE